MTTPAASGADLIISIFESARTVPICTAIATGTNVATTGGKSVAISGCNLVVGGGYRIALSSDDTSLAIPGIFKAIARPSR